MMLKFELNKDLIYLLRINDTRSLSNHKLVRILKRDQLYALDAYNLQDSRIFYSFLVISSIIKLYYIITYHAVS